jgi:hypothetical protein
MDSVAPPYLNKVYVGTRWGKSGVITNGSALLGHIDRSYGSHKQHRMRNPSIEKIDNHFATSHHHFFA